jgi:hypothetical protein
VSGKSTGKHDKSVSNVARGAAVVGAVFDARRENAATTVGEGGAPASFKGLSGCSIWKVNATIIERVSWTPSHAKIIAVQTSEYMNPGVFKGTNVLRAIHADCPELRPSTGLGVSVGK